MDVSNKLSTQLKGMKLQHDPASVRACCPYPALPGHPAPKRERTPAGRARQGQEIQPWRSNRQCSCCCQTGSMNAIAAPSIEVRLPLLAAEIGARIPGAQVRLFGSRARGNASPDSDIDLLITVPDIWLASHDRWLTLSELRRRLAMVDVSLDLLLFSEAEVAERQHWQSHVIGQAYREGQLLHGPL